jgi:hypothetical protein
VPTVTRRFATVLFSDIVGSTIAGSAERKRSPN